MTQVFENISDEVWRVADAIWTIALSQRNSVQAAEFIDTAMRYLASVYTSDELKFIDFYIRLQMEKNEV